MISGFEGFSWKSENKANEPEPMPRLAPFVCPTSTPEPREEPIHHALSQPAAQPGLVHEGSKPSCIDNVGHQEGGLRFSASSEAQPQPACGLLLETQGTEARAESQQVTSSVRTLNSALNDSRCGLTQTQAGRAGGRDRMQAST